MLNHQAWTGGSVVHYCLSNYLILKASSHCKHGKGTLLWLNAEHLKDHPPPPPPPPLADL